jgi:WD40 repeat protein
MANKFKCVISHLAFGLLATFLAQQELLLAAAIINDRVQFVRLQQVPKHSDAGSGLLLELIAYTNVASVTRDRLPALLLGVPGKSTRMGSVPNYLGDELYREWLIKIVLRSFFNASAKEQQLGSGSDFWRAHEEGPVGDALEPSVLLCTLTNAHDGMTCMHINDSGEQAVGGFRDSCVRVWSLSGRGWAGPRGGSGSVDSSSSSATFNVLPRGDSTHAHANKTPYGAGGGAAAHTPSAPPRGVDDGRRSNLPLLELRGHSAPVYSVSQEQVHSHGRLVLSSSSDHTIRLWDTTQRQTVGKYNCAATVWGVAFSPIGYYFAAAAADRTVSVYATDRPTQLRFMSSHMSDATCVAWHPNATMLVSGSDDKTVYLWDVRTGSYSRILRGCPSAVACCAVAPQGDRVAAGTDTGSVHVWDLASGMQLGLLQGHKGPVHSVAFSDAGEALSSGGADYTVRTWDMNQLLGPQGPANEPMPMHSSVPIHRPAQTFHSKFTPAFHVTYTPRNLLLAGGPYALSGAGLAQSALLHDMRSKEEVIAALGLSYAQKH